METKNYSIFMNKEKSTVQSLYIKKSIVEYTKKNSNYAKKLEQKIDAWLKDMGINGWKTNVIDTEIIIVCTSRSEEKYFNKLEVEATDQYYILNIMEESVDFSIKSF